MSDIARNNVPTNPKPVKRHKGPRHTHPPKPATLQKHKLAAEEAAAKQAAAEQAAAEQAAAEQAAADEAAAEEAAAEQAAADEAAAKRYAEWAADEKDAADQVKSHNAALKQVAAQTQAVYSRSSYQHYVLSNLDNARANDLAAEQFVAEQHARDKLPGARGGPNHRYLYAAQPTSDLDSFQADAMEEDQPLAVADQDEPDDAANDQLAQGFFAPVEEGPLEVVPPPPPDDNGGYASYDEEDTSDNEMVVEVNNDWTPEFPEPNNTDIRNFDEYKEQDVLGGLPMFDAQTAFVPHPRPRDLPDDGSADKSPLPDTREDTSEYLSPVNKAKMPQVFRWSDDFIRARMHETYFEVGEGLTGPTVDPTELREPNRFSDILFPVRNETAEVPARRMREAGW